MSYDTCRSWKINHILIKLLFLINFNFHYSSSLFLDKILKVNLQLYLVTLACLLDSSRININAKYAQKLSLTLLPYTVFILVTLTRVYPS